MVQISMKKLCWKSLFPWAIMLWKDLVKSHVRPMCSQHLVLN
uniref:Uncharacterized protein n=1 Tax=Arundo donax TaxID=35708 RepID=A0A0A9A8V2_ARUDO